MLRLRILKFFFAFFCKSIGQSLPGSGNAFQGNGVAFVSIPDFSSVTFPLSVSAWIKVDNINTFQCIFQSDGTPGTGYRGFRFQINPNMVLHMGISQGQTGCYANQCTRWWSGQLPLSFANNWIHVAAVMPNVNTCIMYLNGIQIPNFNGGAGQFVMATNVNATAIIGSYITTSPISQFTGQIDEVAIWSIALTPAQIREFMCKRVPATTLGLEAVYRFDEPNGAAVIDQGPNSKNGTLTNPNIRVVSGAPIGDESAYFYPPVPGTLINAFNDTIQVALGFGNPDGYHIYSVNQPPNHTNGFDASVCPPNRYYGVFHANSPNSVVSSFTVKNASEPVSQPHVRNNNADPIWVEVPNSLPFYIAISTENHKEIIPLNTNSQPTFEPKIDIPNVFTPNNDGINDYFDITIEGDTAAVWVYNRWGQEVFYSKNYNSEVSGWNGTYQGKPLASGAYAYRVDFQAETQDCNDILHAGIKQYFGFVHIIP